MIHCVFIFAMDEFRLTPRMMKVALHGKKGLSYYASNLTVPMPPSCRYVMHACVWVMTPWLGIHGVHVNSLIVDGRGGVPS